MKYEISMKELCKDCPYEFFLYMNYCMGLEFEQKPDYGFLRVLMQSLANREHLELDINCFDWCFILDKRFNHASYDGHRYCQVADDFRDRNSD